MERCDTVSGKEAMPMEVEASLALGGAGKVA